MSYYTQPRERNDKLTAEESQANLQRMINDMPMLPPVVVDIPTSYSYHTKVMDLNAAPNNTFSKQLLQYIQNLAATTIDNYHQVHKLQRTSKRIEKILLSQNPRGEVISMSLTISTLTHIDFVDSNYTSASIRNSVNIPQTQLYQIIVTNTGTNDAKFKTNTTANDTTADALLSAGQTIDLKFPVPTIKSLNLVCPTGTTTISLLCIV